MSDNKTGPVQRESDGIRHWLGRLWWVAPAIVLAGGELVPELRSSVSTGFSAPHLPWWLLGEFVLCVAWFVMGFVHVTSSTTSVAALKADAAISNTVQLGFVILASYQATKGHLQWGIVIPALTTIADVYITGDRAINNAAQKPIVQQQNVK